MLPFDETLTFVCLKGIKFVPTLPIINGSEHKLMAVEGVVDVEVEEIDKQTQRLRTITAIAGMQDHQALVAMYAIDVINQGIMLMPVQPDKHRRYHYSCNSAACSTIITLCGVFISKFFGRDEESTNARIVRRSIVGLMADSVM